ncbi:preprotein translocase subunit SecG [Rickettsiaceae bacterium]|nr:preprotein translocase subunit SecG [Rickettsiaceae bacterium]
MLNTLLFVHLSIAILLVIVILLQKTSTDGLSGIGGGNNMGLVSGRSAANFLTRTTVILAVVFFANAIMLANLSSRSNKDVLHKQDTENTGNAASVEEKSLPVK